MSSARRDAFFEHANRFESDGHAEARRGEAGRIADDDRRSSPSSPPLRAPRATVSSEVRSPRTISISFITCGGLKKCSPTKRSRRSTDCARSRDRDRRRVRGEDRLFAAEEIRLREEVLLQIEILRHRFDDQIGRMHRRLEVGGEMNPRAAPRPPHPLVTFPRSTPFCSVDSIDAFAASSAPASASWMTVS